MCLFLEGRQGRNGDRRYGDKERPWIPEVMTRRLSGSVKGIRVRVAVKGGEGSGVAMAESFGHKS